MQTRHLLVETIPQMFSALQEKMDIRTSTTDAFVTFYLLSYSKLNGLALSYTVVQHI